MKELVGQGKPFYSAVDKAAGLLKRKVGTGAEFMQELKGLGGIKQSEIEDRGLGELMGAPKMTHEQFMSALAAKPAPAIHEKVFGKPDEEQQKLINKKAHELAYKEAYDDLRTEGESHGVARAEALDLADVNSDRYLRNAESFLGVAAPYHEQHTLPGGENYREMLIKAPKVKQQFGDKNPYFNGVYNHFGGEPAILASMRLKDRTGPNGEKLLHLEELQSDWHQQGREKGYQLKPNKTTNPDGTVTVNFGNNQKTTFQNNSYADDAIQTATLNIRGSVPNAPFKKNWEEMALKRLIHHAAEKGYHGIVVTPGAEQANRYNLANHIDSLHFSKNSDGTVDINAVKDRDTVVDKTMQTPEQIESMVGKELAQKIFNTKTSFGSLEGLDLQVGGEGMKGFYDKKVPNILNSIGKKYGVKTELGGHQLQGSPEDYANAVEKLGIANIPMAQLTPEQNQKIAETADKRLHYFPINEQMRKDVLTNGLPLHKEGGIIHKAVGGTVQPSMNQMRAELIGKKPVSLSDLSTIGANEAPNMNVKAYIPPSGGQLPVGGVSMGDQPLPIGGIDMSQGQQGNQLMPASLIQPPQGGQPPQAGGMPSPLSAGASSPAQQPPSNILQMTPQGQALNAMSPPQPARMAVGGSVPAPYKIGGSDNMPPPDNGWKPDNGVSTFNIDNVQQAAKGGKVEVRSTVFDDAATRRNPKIEAAARALLEGEMKQKAYAKVVAKEKPVKPYDFVPMPATEEDALRAIGEKKMNKWKAHDTWPAGRRVGLRLDIPSYERHGVWMNTVHDEEGTGENKLPTSHGPVSSVRNAVFEGSPEKAVRVATGEQNKNSFAKIMGELEHIDEDKALKHMIKYLRHPEYRQVGYDPRRHGDFYDRETMEPITHAEHVVQIGPLVLAKKPVYGKRTLYKEGGAAKPTTKRPEKFKPKATKASEALGKHEGKHLKVTQSDRTKVGGGFLGGPGFSGLQHLYPSHKDVAWGVNSSGAASKIANANAAHPEGDVLWSTLIGAPTQHTSNQMVFDMLMKQFKGGIKSGKMTPELRDRINAQLAIAVDKDGKPIFANPDIASKNFFSKLNTFDQRRVMADLMGGNKVGGKKGQIFNYDKTVEDTTEPELLGAPTHAIGPRLFQLSGERSVQPELNPAFPHMLHGEDLGQMFHPVPREIMLPEFHGKIRQTKGRNAGFMDLTRNTPSQHLTEEFLTHLQKHGYKKGGKVNMSTNMDTINLELSRKSKKAK